MGFRFLHTADWQLGKPFRRFGPEKGSRLQASRIDVITRLADLARQENAGHVVVAGDVWDQEMPSDRDLRQPLARMAEASQLHWWLLPGNHDPVREESLWNRLRAFGVPEHIHLLTEAVPSMMEEGVYLLPAPWTSKRPGQDLTAAYDRMETPPDALRLGVGHGGVMSFGSRSDESAVIPEDRAERSGLRYLALGDWHGTRPAGARAWYAGTPEPDAFRRTDQGQALIVDMDNPEKPAAHRTGQYEWLDLPLELEAGRDPVRQIGECLPADRVLDRTLVKLTATGRLTLSEHAALDARLAEDTARVFHLEADLVDVDLLADTADFDERLGQGALRRVADRLLAMREGPEGADAERALRELDLLSRS